MKHFNLKLKAFHSSTQNSTFDLKENDADSGIWRMNSRIWRTWRRSLFTLNSPFALNDSRVPGSHNGEFQADSRSWAKLENRKWRLASVAFDAAVEIPVE